MNSIEEIENASGLYMISKMKTMYYVGYGERIAYMINLDSMEGTWKEIK